MRLREFTPRQIEVLKLYLKGLGNKEIGRILGVSWSSIDSIILTIHSKLATYDRIDAQEKALKLGLVSIEDLGTGAIA